MLLSTSRLIAERSKFNMLTNNFLNLIKCADWQNTPFDNKGCKALYNSVDIPTNIYENKFISKIDKDMESFLLSAAWPGNIRELRNFIERSVLLIKTEILHLDDTHKIDSAVLQQLNEVQSKTFNVHLNPQPESNLLHIAQKQLIDQALELTKYNHTKAAKLLGIPRTSLNYYIKRYNDKISKHQNPL